MNILCCSLCFSVVCRCYNWGHNMHRNLHFSADFLLTELFTSLCDTFQFWQILTDGAESSFSLSSPQPAPEPVLRAQHARTAHKHARQGSFPEHTHARLRLSRALEKSEHWRLSGGVWIVGKRGFVETLPQA